MLNLTIEDPDILAKICHALSTPLRLQIIRLLDNEVLSCLELSKRLGYPMSTISTNVKILEEAGLVISHLLPAKNGSKKMCSLVYGEARITLAHHPVLPESPAKYEVDVPIGNYMDFEVAPSCGLVVDALDPATFDIPNVFLSQERIKAQLLWFRKGYVEYKIPLGKTNYQPKSISFEMELCSEAPGFNNKWKSDITMWINGIEIGTWTSPADFGDRRGKFTPEFWTMGNTQYGLLTNWCVTEDGTTLNGETLSDIRLSGLDLFHKDFVTMRIGVKDTAANVGGLNIFGEKFGDYPQAIKLCIYYKETENQQGK